MIVRTSKAVKLERCNALTLSCVMKREPGLVLCSTADWPVMRAEAFEIQ